MSSNHLEEDGKSSYVIETKNLTKHYDDFLAVDKLNLKIRKGEVFGFLGPNGAGKTTSIKMMVGLLKPTSGEILIDGESMSSANRDRIGVCPQESVLWDSLTCRENLAFMGNMYDVPKDELYERIEKLLDDMKLSDKIDTYASNLSGGMKSRLNLAMALIHNPEIVFLDEPSAGLDPQSRLVLWDYIQSLCKKQGKTVVLTTHFMDEADTLSDRIAIIDHGQLLLLNTPDKLKQEVGTGDVVELTFSDPRINNDVIKLINCISDIGEVKEIRGKVRLRSLNAVGKIPKIISIVEKMDTEIVDMSIRKNTLEDVFIHLTGRGLRE